jgi:hypothetical protein
MRVGDHRHIIKGNKTHINRIIQVEIIMSIEMALHKLADLLLTCRMQILEFMHSLELDDVKAIR